MSDCVRDPARCISKIKQESTQETSQECQDGARGQMLLATEVRDEWRKELQRRCEECTLIRRKKVQESNIEYFKKKKNQQIGRTDAAQKRQ